MVLKCEKHEPLSRCRTKEGAVFYYTLQSYFVVKWDQCAEHVHTVFRWLWKTAKCCGIYVCVFFSCVNDVDWKFKHVQLASMPIIRQKPSHDCFFSLSTLYTTCRNLGGAATTHVAPQESVLWSCAIFTTIVIARVSFIWRFFHIHVLIKVVFKCKSLLYSANFSAGLRAC